MLKRELPSLCGVLLPHMNSYCTVAHLFGVARSTVCEIVQETCQAIVSNLMQDYIRFPTGEALKAVVEGFEEKWGFPQCIGAIDD